MRAVASGERRRSLNADMMDTRTNEPSSSMIDNLRRMADEIRVRIHLAGMEAKDAWAKLEPRFHELEQKAAAAKDRLAEGLDKAGDELKEQMSKLLDRIKGDDGSGSGKA
jgi:hypothetical protein